MTTAATIAARLTLDKSDYDKGLGDAGKQASNFQSSMSSVGQSMSRAGGMMTAALTVPVAGAFTMMVTSASDLSESANAMNVVFEGGASAIEKFGEQSAETIGLAKSDWYQLAAVQGAALKNYGYSQEQAAEETIKLGTRAADMASIFNTDVNDAMTAISALMRGETEPIKRYGVSMNEAAIKAKAMSMGLIEMTVDGVKVNGLLLKLEKSQAEYSKAVKKYGEDSLEARTAAQGLAETEADLESAMEGSAAQMTQAQKAQASLALFYDQTDQFAGDFANTSDQLANSSRILKAQLKDEAAALGTDLLPYVLQAVTYFRELIGKFQALSPEQKKWIMVIMGAVAVLGPLLIIIGSIVTAISALIPVITAVAGLFSVPLILIILAVIAVLAALYYAWVNNLGGIQEIVADAWETVTELFEEAMDWIYDLTHGQLGELSEVWKRTTGFIKQAVDIWFKQIRLLFQAFKAAFSGDWEGLGRILRQMWDNAWNGMKLMVQTSWANIRSFLSSAVASLQSWWGSINWADLGRNLIIKIRDGMLGALPLLLSGASNILSALGSFFSGFFGGGGNVPYLPPPPPDSPTHANGTNGWLTVPPGYPGDSYTARMTSGEQYAVVKKGDSLPGGSGTVNYFHPQITIVTGKVDPRKSLKGLV